MQYFTPGIYVVEESTGARPIGSVGTSTAGFVGVSPDRRAHVNEAVAIGSWSEFLRNFYTEGQPSTDLARAVFGFFDNQGSRCFVVNIGDASSITGKKGRRAGLDVLQTRDEISIVAAPGFVDNLSTDALLSHCENLADRVAILDAPADVEDISTLTEVMVSTERPPADAGPDAPAGAGPAGAGPPTGRRARQSDKGYGALYFPWLLVRDPLTGELVRTPPSGHVAGIWARTDALRGVHKAPANETVRGAVGLTTHLTDAEQGVLNPRSVNCIRSFSSEGIRVWGARTLAAEASEWRYLNVRRLFTMLEESILQGTRWMVFEPNEFGLWKSIRRDIGAFLTRVWRDGALLGRTPEEAFFVKCDEETNPVEMRDAGVVVAVIGVAVVKPAEFVVFKLSQWAGGADTETMGI